jgi:hypothetical protein
MIDAVWQKLQSLRLYRIDGGAPLRYWGVGCSEDYQNVGDLLKHRNGPCGAWARFAKDILAVLGIESDIKTFKRGPYNGYNDLNEPVVITLYLDSVTINGVNHSSLSDYRIYQRATDYQGFATPPSIGFSDHAINKINNKYYDVTCGSGPYDSLTDYLQANICLAYYENGVWKYISGNNLTSGSFIVPGGE